MSGNYFPNNWEAWNDMPEEFLHTPTWEEFEDWKLRGWEIPSSVCCIIRAETAKGKIKEYVYQKQHAAEKRIKQLVSEGASFAICTDEELRYIAPIESHESD